MGFDYVGESAWTPEETTYYNFLNIELDSIQEVHKVATQGRSSTLEFVTEYIVQYSSDGQTWTSVTDPSGNIEVLIDIIELFHWFVSCVVCLLYTCM